jgi:hypothetical protein
MDIGNYVGNALGGAVGGAAAGLLMGFAMHKGLKFDKKLAVTGATVFAGVAIVTTALGKDIPLLPKTAKLGGGHRLPAAPPATAGAWGPWYAPNYYW